MDADGFLTQMTAPGSAPTLLTYNNGSVSGLLASLTEPGGGVHRFTYDNDGRLTRDENPRGEFSQLARTDIPGGHVVTVSTSAGTTTSYSTETLANGQRRRIITDPAGAQTTLLADPNGTETIRFPDGTVAQSVLSPDPRWAMLAPLSGSISVTLPGRPAVTRTFNRAVTLATPDDPLSVTRLTDTVVVNGQTVTSDYDAATRTSTFTSPTGKRSTLAIDVLGRPLRYDLPGIGVAPVTWGYNTGGRLASTVQGSQSWTFAYDAANRLISRTDAAGRAVRFDFDNADHLTQTTLPSGAAIGLGYDAASNQNRLTLAGGAIHMVDYSSTHQPSSYTPPGNPAGYTRAFDLNGRLTSVSLPSGATQAWTYDSQGRPAGVSTVDATTTVGYAAGDLTHRVALVRRVPIAGGGPQDLAYQYVGPFVSRLTFSGPSSGQYAYSYDANLRLTGMDLTSGTTSAPFALAYNADGQPTTLGPFALTRNGPGGLPTRIGDGVGQFDLTFDAASRLATRAAAVGGTPVYREQLTRDTGGRISQRTETIGATTTTFDYAYDADSRLLNVLRNGVVAEQYAYDGRGNRSSKQLGAAPPEAASYDLQDRIQSNGATNYAVNTDGFMVGRGSDTFQYGARGELLSATIGGQTASFGYDGFGRRTSRTDASGSYQYLYGNPDNDLQLTAARDPAGVLSTYLYDDGGRLVGIQRGPARFYLATNILGSPVAVADSSGTIVKRLDWDAFGTVIADSNPSFDLPLGFAGGLRDSLTGLTRFGLRDYDPVQGRWVSRDPAVFDGGQTNLYAYVDNDPLNKVDPSGFASLGASFYDDLGGGAKLAFNEKGLSVCAEAGVGYGDSIELNPFGDLDKEGTSLDASVAFKYGPVAGIELAGKAPLDPCEKSEVKGKACLLVFCAEKTRKDGKFGDTEPKGETDVNTLKGLKGLAKRGLKDLFGNLGVKLEAKVVATSCVQFKF